MSRSLSLLLLLAACGPADSDGDGIEDELDCAPEDASVYPGASDDAVDGTDQDCDDFDGPDIDGDGFADAEAGGQDCDDTRADVHPGATETCDDIDSDCDGDLVEGAPDFDQDGLPDCVDPAECYAAPEGLLAWWRGEGDATDSTSNLDSQADGDLAWSDGMVGRAFDLGSASRPVTIADPEPFLGTGSRSFEAWVQTEVPKATLFSHYECGGTCSSRGIPSPSAYVVSINTDGHLTVGVRDFNHPSGTPGGSLTSTVVVSDGDWHHIVAVADSGDLQLRLYIDGELDAELDVAADLLEGFAQDGHADVDPLTIGWHRNSGDARPMNQLVGMLDEVSVYTSALDEDDAWGLYVAQGEGKCLD